MKYLKLFVLIGIIVVSACSGNKKGKENATGLSGDLIIFHAGSLSVPFKEVAEQFKKEYPEVNILSEAAGSRSCARKITDLKRKCDIMASADYTVIDNLLIPDYTSWNIRFATNEMTIVFTEDSKYSNEINKDNWFDILLKDDVVFGRSDPNADPCGYRAVLTIKLAENYYHRKGLAENILDKDLNFIRPKEVDLLALLESHSIDYIFLYRSVAQQHGLKYLIHPDEINLKNPEFASVYSMATTEISGKKPGEFITKKGEPMVYGVTVLKDAPNRQVAMKFVEFLLTKEKGMAIMEKNGQPSLVPSYTDTFEKIPGKLKVFAKKETN